MQIVDDLFPALGTEVALSKVTIEYTQNLDCCQSESDYPDGCQVLTITTDDGGGGKFMRLSTTESGWSFDSIDDLIQIITDFKQRVTVESTKH